MKRLTVQFNDDTWNLIESLNIANTDAEKVRAIVVSYLSEKSLISSSAKRRMKLI
jgi:hypothetical protein